MPVRVTRWPPTLPPARFGAGERLQSPTYRHGSTRDLKTLLVRRSGLAALQRDLEAEIENRQPRPPAGTGPDIAPVVERLTLAELDPPALITSDKELEEWLSALRTQLRAKLRANRQIRLE